MKDPINNNELPPAVQYAALSALWLTWLAAAGLVAWKANQNARRAVAFDEEGLIYAVLLTGFPLVLAVAGLLVYRRVRSAADLPFAYRLLHVVFAVLTLVAVATFLFLGLAACCMAPGKIRE